MKPKSIRVLEYLTTIIPTFKTKALTVNIPEPVYNYISYVAREHFTTNSEVVKFIVSDYKRICEEYNQTIPILKNIPKTKN